MKGPKPLVEHHYHIEELIDRQQKRHDDRTYDREYKKSLYELNKDIQEAKMMAATEFLCTSCHTEFKGVAVKQISEQFDGSYIAFYRHKCDCGKFCIRYITDKHKDPYWTRSKVVAMDKGKHYKDMLQPHETGFTLLYNKI